MVNSVQAETNVLIQNGRLVDPSQGIDRIARLLVTDGHVAAIDPADGDVPADCPRIDAAGRIVAPGLVDLGAELREPGNEEDETVQSASDAALAGGFTSVLCCQAHHPVSIHAGQLSSFVRKQQKPGACAFMSSAV